MKINLITHEEFNYILTIAKNNTRLTLQKDGYEYINPRNLDSSDIDSLAFISDILSKSIVGFRKFNNFKRNKDNELILRFQYNYGASDNSTPFNGVGYIKLSELLNGFDN